MQLQTTRCTIRYFGAEDIDAFMQYRNDADWMRFQDFKCRMRQDYEEALSPDRTLRDGMQLAIIETETGRLIGDLYLRQDDATIWLGYTVAPHCARAGFACEAASGMIAWLRENGHASVSAGVLPGNKASIALLRKLGFSYMGMSDGEQVYRLLL